MKRHFRLAYFYLIAGLFLVLAPILLLYGMGFIFDANALELRRTGSLYLQTFPEGAEVMLDGKTLSRQTPVLINRLSEGSVEVTVKKEGYTSWTRRVEIVRNKTQIFDSISLLYLGNEEERIAELQPDTVIVPNASGQHFLFVSPASNGTALHFSGEQEDRIVIPFPSVVLANEIQWSGNNQNVAVPIRTEQRNEVWILNINPHLPLLQLPKDLPKPATDSSLAHIQWSPSTSEELFLQLGEQFFRWNVVSKTLVSFNTTLNDAWVVNDRGLLSVTKDGVRQWELIEGNAPIQSNIMLNSSSARPYPLSRKNLLVTENSTDQTLSLFSENAKEWNPIALSIIPTMGTWSPSGNNLILANAYEILLYRPEQKTQRLLLRSSQPISDVTWLSSDRGFMFQQGEEIKALLFDRDVDSDFTVTLFDQPALKFVGLDNEDRVVTLREQERIWELLRIPLKKPSFPLSL